MFKKGLHKLLKIKSVFLLTVISTLVACHAQDATSIRPGAYQTGLYLPLVESKSVGLVVNHTSVIEDTHLVDSLINLNVDLKVVFTPEHGFRGTLSDGEKVEYEKNDAGYQLVSLYGKTKKPTREHLADLDLVLFDIQDVGARFYTYISTMHLVMEACAESNIPFVMLDRPNPNASFIDGPVLEEKFQSFVGMHPIPIVYGMTIGELAQMINGERWLKNGIQADLTVIPIKNWTHDATYSLRIKPSPNLPNDLSIALYPSLCLFEGTIISVGRGTDLAFQQIGHPRYPDLSYSFVPQPNEGSKWPPYEGEVCYGISFKDQNAVYELSLEPLLNMYQKMGSTAFFNDYFVKLAGTDELQQQIINGVSEAKIRSSWNENLEVFKAKRANYLLYD